jgi:hypothetical protein
MPDSVEMPAPVNTTARLLLFSMAASEAGGENMVSRLRMGRILQ